MKNLSIIGIIRGLAAIAVVLFHFSQVKYGAPEMWRNIFVNGQLGVHVFFVISGFVIPLQLSRRRYEVKNFASFLCNRFIRIYPLFIIVSFLAACIWLIQYAWLGGEQMPDISVSNIIKNLTFTAGPLTGSYYVNVSWTLAIEFMYYVFLGLAFPYLFSKSILIRVSANSLFLLSYFLLGFDSSWNFFAWSPYFAVGYYLFRMKTSKVDFEVILFLFLALLIIAFDPGMLPSFHQLIAVVLVSLLILFPLNFNNRAFLYLGVISYSLYLTHNVFGPKLFRLIELVGADKKLGYFPSLVLVVCFSTGIAHVFYKIIEVPSHSYSKKAWIFKWFKQGATAPELEKDGDAKSKTG
jgi:peptidoglycan/LPS O-acetylase OafA/YrhL